MDKFLGGRTRRRRLVLPAWWYQRCSIPGCTVPLWPQSDVEDKDDYGCDMRSDKMRENNLSYTQICALCNVILCRYHLSPPIDFAERWSYDFQQLEFYPPVARLCQKCILDVEIEFIVFENT